MNQLPPRKITVSYRKQVSDGNYGTEAAEVTLEDWLEQAHDGFLNAAVERLQKQARQHVEEQLGQSTSARVRAAVEVEA